YHDFVFMYADTTVVYALSLHDALPICRQAILLMRAAIRVWHGFHDSLSRQLAQTFRENIAGDSELLLKGAETCHAVEGFTDDQQDRKSTRLNSSHVKISYAVFCLKKKK